MDARIVPDGWNRLREPDCGSVLDDRRVRLGEIGLPCSRIERGQCAVYIRIERRTFIGPIVVSAGRARASYPPRSLNCTRTRLRVPRIEYGVEHAFSLALG